MVMILSISPKGEKLKSALIQLGEDVVLISDMVTERHINKYKPDFVISHGYDKLVSAEIIRMMDGHIINTHPSVLPLNRGMFPNFWSFIYDTPKGFTIHNMTPKIDAGDILIQKEFSFDIRKETFQTTYTIIEDSLHETLIENWERLKSGLIGSKIQQGMSTFHDLRKFNQFKKEIPFQWDDNIYNFLTKNEEKIKNFLNTYDDGRKKRF